MGNLRPLPETCKNPSVLFAAISVPAAEKGGYRWRYATQALLANPQFKIVDATPTAPMEVHFLSGWSPATSSLALIGRCKDSATCHKLAAMYQAVVPTSKPQLACGDPPFGTFDQASAENMTRASLAAALPDGSDTISQCARLAACRIASEPGVKGDPALECQKAPAKFKLSCASRRSCSDVVACSK
jgi:hypothetical protein